MNYQLVITRPAEKSFHKLPKSARNKIRQVLVQMEDNPYDGDILRLKGSDNFRRRVGNYRILFKIDSGLLMIFVIDIRKRDEKTYKGL